jgi:hypothetical protein
MTSTNVDRVRRSSGAVSVTAATSAAAAVWIAADIAGTTLTVGLPGRPPMTIGLPLVIGTALAASLAGSGSLAVLERLSTRGRTWWAVLAVATLLASFGPVLTAQTTGGARLTLALMHIAVAAVLIPGLLRRRRR